MSKIEDIEGIGPAKGKKLRAAGVTSVAKLLELGGKKSGRKDLAAKTGMDEKVILKFVNMADLFRIKGVGEEYSELLEAAGVDTVVELSKRKPANLAAKMKEVNDKKKLVRSVPSETVVTKWVAQAKELPRGVHY